MFVLIMSPAWDKERTLQLSYFITKLNICHLSLFITNL